MNVIVFEDELVEQLNPLTLARPAFSVTCACNRLQDWFLNCAGHVTLSVREYLQPVCEANFPDCSQPLSKNDGQTLLINARIVPSASNFSLLDGVVDQLANGSELPQIVAKDANSEIMVAAVPTRSLAGQHWQTTLSQIATAGHAKSATQIDSLRYPHDVVAFNQQYFNENLQARILKGDYQEISDGVFVGRGANVHQSVVADTRNGPVVVETGATVGPYSYFSGPVYVGRNCKVLEHSSIKDYVCLSHTVKAGGEVEASVIEPYSNKQHHGFLGHSYLGSWINIGAGTCNSDLKNTYGQVNVKYGGKKIATGQQFVGCFIGDYSKTAINTSIFTGKTIGVCSMLYGFITENVPSFVNHAATLGQIGEIPVDVMVTTQQRMFARRGIEPRACDVKLIKDLSELTASHRTEMSDRPLFS